MNKLPKSVAIIIRALDRADELAYSLPRLLNQDYPNYDVYVIDHSSQDDLPAVLVANESSRLHVIRVPRPEYFNRSRASNIGVRYTESDLVFFLDSGIGFRDKHHLSEIIQAYEDSEAYEPKYFEHWRARSGYASLGHMRMTPPEPATRRVYMECECHGLHLMAPRELVQQVGGLNEALLDWGFEDTDLVTRFELSGYARLEITELVHSEHNDSLRTRFHREQEKEKSWAINKQISDGFIRTFGPVLATQPTPGMPEWVEIDGKRYEGAKAPQQPWRVKPAAERYPWRMQRAFRNVREPIVSVVVPTRDAAQYIVVVLDSILSQDYESIECIVADGGSTDATLEILKAYGNRISWSSEPDNGAFDAINRGWQSSRGEILAWLNADDFWTPGAVTNAVKVFREDPNADLIYGNCLIVDGDDNILEHRRPPLWDLAWAVENSHHMIDQPAMFLRRSIAERVGWLYPAWFHDWELWRRVSLAGGNIRRVPYLLGAARIRRDNSQYNPNILIKGLIDLQNRFFAMPAVTNNLALRKLKKRAISNTYLKIIQTLQYGRPEEKRLRRQLRWRALRADWTNLFNVLRIRPRGRSFLPYDPQEHVPLPRIGSIQELKHEGAPERYNNGSKPALPVGTRTRAVGLADRYEPLVSVVIPCRNDIRFLPTVIESVLSQDYPNIECIVIDADSTDGTQKLLRRYGDKIRWLSRKDNGAFDAINDGWRMAKGDVLAWLNADDVWTPGAVRTAVDFLASHPQTDVVYGTVGVVDEVGVLWGDLVPNTFDLRHALLQCDHMIYQAASFIRRPILEEVNYLYPAWCHDHDLWLRIAHEGGQFGKVDARLGVDRLRGDNLGRQRDLVIDAKLGLTKRFFSNPNLLPQLIPIRRRALSNAYVRCLDYLSITHPGDWFKAASLMTHAIVADPRNTRHVLNVFSKPFRWHARTKAGPPLRRALGPVRFGWRTLKRGLSFLLHRLVGLLVLSGGMALVALLGVAAYEDGTLQGVVTRLFEAGALAALGAIWLQLRWR